MLYDIVCVARFGSTLGKLVFRLRVVTAGGRDLRVGASGMPASMYHVVTVLNLVSGLAGVAFLGLLVTLVLVATLRGAIRDPLGKTWWDGAADTRVITTPRGVPRFAS